MTDKELAQIHLGVPDDYFDFDKVSDIEFDGIDHRDFPDYCDVYIVSAKYDGRDATEQELDTINDNRSFVYDQLMEYLY